MRTCEICEKTLLKRQKRFCSKAHYGQWLRENPENRNWFKPGTPPWNKGLKGYHSGVSHWNWKGGKRYHSSGYIEIYCPNHPSANSGGYVLEHRLVMEKQIDRYLSPDEIVHHINGNKQDNKIENLMLLTASEHQSMHTKKWWNYIKDLIAADKEKHQSM